MEGIQKTFLLGDTGRVAWSSAIAEANPDATFEYRSRLLDNLVSIGEAATNLNDLISPRLLTRADRFVRELFDMMNQDRMAAVVGIVRLVDNLTDEEKATHQAVLQHSAKHMPRYVVRNASMFSKCY